MGICSRRHFVLTICTLQLITTIERQVFDFLGFMWAPILVNFFNIIFVILGFFGAFQYRPKYIISFCIWNTLWLGWNVFLICFYLNVGVLDKNSDILNLGTGSFSWWQTNGPGCNAIYNITEPELFRPARPSNVTGCALGYEVIEVLHASTQCLLAVMAIISGICVTKLFFDEDDSFDFVGGDDFGLAGHTPLHPMYVSYSALPPNVCQKSNQSSARNTLQSQETLSRYDTKTSFLANDNDANKSLIFFTRDRNFQSRSGTGKSSCSSQRRHRQEQEHEFAAGKGRTGTTITSVDYNDYSNPVDHLHRPVSPLCEYDTLDSVAALRFQKNKFHHSNKYSPVVTKRIKSNRDNSLNKQHRNSYKGRVFTDYVREQPLRSFYSDPKLGASASGAEKSEAAERPNPQQHRERRPLSLHATANVNNNSDDSSNNNII